MSDASVGFHCPTCVREGRQSQRRPTTLVGGRPPSGTPVITYGIIVLCTVMLLLQQTIPGLTAQLEMFGGTSGGTAGVAHGQVWRLLTAALLHEGLIHLLFNMLALYFVGGVLEPLLGRARYIVLFVLSALGGSTASMLAHPAGASVGASGAVFGLFGAYFVLARRLQRDTGQIIGLIVINAVLGFVIPRVEWQAHLGGLIVGALFTLALLVAPRAHRVQFQALGGGILVCASLALVAVRSLTLT